jgi:hypothetical protein
MQHYSVLKYLGFPTGSRTWFLSVVSYLTGSNGLRIIPKNAFGLGNKIGITLCRFNCVQQGWLMSDTTPEIRQESVPSTNMMKLALSGFGVMIGSSLLVFLFLPFLLPFAPVVLILGGMMAWALVAQERASRHAQKIAAARLGGRQSDLNVVEAGNDGIINSGELVLNDWGVVYAKSGSPTFEAAWNEITLADEPSPKILKISSSRGSMQMEPQRWSLITSTLVDKLPGRTDFDFNPHTLESNILSKLQRKPREWPKHKFRIDRQGFDWKGRRYNFDDIENIEEKLEEYEDGSCYYWLIKSRGAKQVRFDDPGDGAMSMFGIILSEAMPERVRFLQRPISPSDRIRAEFAWWWEALQAALKVAKSQGSYNSKLGRHLEYMKWMVDKYDCIARYNAEKLLPEYDAYRAGLSTEQ